MKNFKALHIKIILMGVISVCSLIAHRHFGDNRAAQKLEEVLEKIIQEESKEMENGTDLCGKT